MKKNIWILLSLVCFAEQVVAKVITESRETIIKNIKKYGDVYLGNFDKKIRGDREIVMIAVKKYGTALKYAVKDLRKDKQIVLEAVSSDGLALEYADKSLRNDREVVLAAVKDTSRALKYANPSLKKDKKIVLAAVKYHPYAIKYADKTLQNNKKFLDQIKKQKMATLKSINKPQKPYSGKIYKAKSRTCWQYDTSSLIAWDSWVAPGKKHLAKDEIKPIEEVYIWTKSQTKEQKLIALVAKVSGKIYRHNYIICHKEKGKFACGGECDSGQLELGKDMKLQLDTLSFVVDDMEGPRAELVLTQRKQGSWLRAKKVACPEYVVEGLNVCYDRKIIDSGISYDGCIRSHLACDKVAKRHFGAYPNENSAQSALIRCEQSRPKR